MLAEGAVDTLWMSVAAFVLGLAFAVVCVFARSSRFAPVQFAVKCYVEVIRNTPLLVQLFIVYFSLPSIGIRLDADEAAVLGLALNFGGYAVEILRSGIAAAPHAQIEAGTPLGLRKLPIFRHVLLFPALR